MATEEPDDDFSNLPPTNQSQESEPASFSGLMLRGANRVLTIEAAMEKYCMNKDRPWPFQMLYQWVCFVAITAGMVCANPLHYGLYLLLHYPNHELTTYPGAKHRGTGMQCYERDKELEEASLPSWLTDGNQVNRLMRWAPCTRAHICETDGLRWRVDPKDPEHMLNFVQRFDLVCSDSGPKTMITAAVVATIIGLIFIPSYSDNYGRKNPFLLSLSVSLVAQFVLIWSWQFEIAVAAMVLIGLTWGGKVVAGTAYILEFFPNQAWPKLIFFICLAQAFSLIALPYVLEHFQNHDSVKIESIFLGFGMISLIYCALFMPDSPHSFWRRNEFMRARMIMAGMLTMNGAGNQRLMFRFANERVVDWNAAVYQIEHTSMLSTEADSGSGQLNILQKVHVSALLKILLLVSLSSVAASSAYTGLEEVMNAANVLSKAIYFGGIVSIAVVIGTLSVNTVSLKFTSLIGVTSSLISLLTIWYLTERHSDHA